MGMVEPRRFAVVKDGKVENVILAYDNFIFEDAELQLIEDAEFVASPNDGWDGTKFLRQAAQVPELAELTELIAEPEAGPTLTLEDRVAALERVMFKGGAV